MTDPLPVPQPVLLPGESTAVALTLDFAEQYGYGNLIAHLKRGWALRLMASTPGLTYEQALTATDVAAYPQHLPIDLTPHRPETEP